jgi:hypothetical protein
MTYSCATPLMIKRTWRPWQKRLKSKGVKPWLDKWNLVPGEPWQPEIEKCPAEVSVVCGVYRSRFVWTLAE